MDWLDRLFPLECQHCGAPEVVRRYFCISCFEGLELSGRRTAALTPYHAVASLYEMEGPALSLMWEYARSPSRRLAKTIAALFVMKLIQLEWPLPEIVLARGGSEQLISRYFRRFVGGGEKGVVMVLGLDQEGFTPMGWEALKYKGDPLLGLSWLCR